MSNTSVLAAAIWFTGIILHLETDSTTHARIAYLVDATNHHAAKHDPKLDIAATDHTVQGTWAKYPDGTYDLRGLELELKATTATSAGVNVTSFSDRVRSLKNDLSSADDLWDELYKKKLKGATASIEYTSGDLSAPRCYRWDAVIMNGAEVCLARWVALDLHDSKTWTIVDKNNSTKIITLKPAARARVWNSSGQSGDHSDLYRKLLRKNTPPNKLAHTGKCCVIDGCVLDTSGAECKPPGSGATVECSNTQWP